MQTPVDYPIIDHARSARFSVDELTYAAFLDRSEALVSPEYGTLVDAPVFDLSQTQRLTASPTAYPTTSSSSLLSPLTALAQSLLARDNSTGNINPVFSRWSRALR